MSELDYLRATALGALQGLTEFLPISSSAHLAVAQRMLGYDTGSPQLLLFDVLAHVGTLAAVFVVFGRSAGRFCNRLIRESSRSWKRSRRGWHIMLNALLATVPTCVIGLAAKDTFESAFSRPMWIGSALIITGGLLAATKALPRAKGGWKTFRWWQAALVGIAQAYAILPGISRSGATICVALYCGLRRRWAAEFSFLIAVPAIVGATCVKLADTIALAPTETTGTPLGPVAAGSFAAFLVGIAALRILLGAVNSARLHYFAFYCWLLGGLILGGVLG